MTELARGRDYDAALDWCADEPQMLCGDARRMTEIPDASVALIVTSPPYAVGKHYEQHASYDDTLNLIDDTLTECERVLEWGGRIAINTSESGRHPIQPLPNDVVDLLNGHGFLLRGEIVWVKPQRVINGCAWGSWRSPANPSLRGRYERIAVASKGSYERHLTPRERADIDAPHEPTISVDDFLTATTNVWEIQPEHRTSGVRDWHPAPFPVELPRRLIELYTYRDDLVLDPFAGSGSTLIAAKFTNRRAVGYDQHADYVHHARTRITQAHKQEALL